MSEDLKAIAERVGAEVRFEPCIEFANVFQLQEFADELRASLPSNPEHDTYGAPPVGGWRPIETAPKDGREMFVVKGFDVTNQNCGARSYTTDPYCVWAGDDGGWTRWPHPFPPTHWMPLPPTPGAALHPAGSAETINTIIRDVAELEGSDSGPDCMVVTAGELRVILERALALSPTPAPSEAVKGVSTAEPLPTLYRVPAGRSYDQRAKAIIAFNTCKGDLDDKLDAAWRASLAAPSHPPATTEPPAGYEKMRGGKPVTFWRDDALEAAAGIVEAYIADPQIAKDIRAMKGSPATPALHKFCEDCGDAVPKRSCWCQAGCVHAAPATPAVAVQAEPVKQTPCGGCGATDESQRCIGCLHPFKPAAPATADEAVSEQDVMKLVDEAIHAYAAWFAEFTYGPSEDPPHPTQIVDGLFEKKEIARERVRAILALRSGASAQTAEAEPLVPSEPPRWPVGRPTYPTGSSVP